MSKIITVRLDEELINNLDGLAIAMGRSRTWLIEQAVQQYIEDNAQQVYAIREALDEYRAGKSVLIPHEEVMAEIDELFKQ